MTLFWFPRLVTGTVLRVTLGREEPLDYVSRCGPRTERPAPVLCAAAISYFERVAA